ncbi:MAG TPA: hypothetical protein VGE72_21505 [Azospirillum sp.]
MSRVKYEVVGKCFVNGSRYAPRGDGKPVYVMARPGLEGAALKLVEAAPKAEAPPVEAPPAEPPKPAPAPAPKAEAKATTKN